MNASSKLAASKILVVDDEISIRKMFYEFLSMLNCRPVVSASFEEAISMMETKSFDIVITDLWLPNESGFDLLKWMQDFRPSVPAIVITGRPCIQSAVKCLKMGAFDYIEKPFDFQKIEETLNCALSQLKSGTINQWDRTNVMQGSDAVFGGYQAIQSLGEGTMGMVFLAEKVVDGVATRCALKIVKNSYLNGQDDMKYRRRFLHEAEAASRVGHPNVVNIIHYGLADGDDLPFIVMEYVDGVSLKKVIEKSADFDVDHKANMICQLTSGLAAIHECLICHRDIKPDNVLVTQDMTVVKITDFGLARLPESKLTVTGNLLGTPSYMAPEGFCSPRVDHRADIFSLGVIAYELFLGRKPFDAPNLPMLAHMVTYDAPTEPKKLCDQFPDSLQAILARMLKKRVDERYQSADEIMTDMNEFLESKTVSNSDTISCLDDNDWN